MIRLGCPTCDAVYLADPGRAGQVAECPACRAQFQIPGAVAPEAPSGGSSHRRLHAPPAPVEIEPCARCGARSAVMPHDLGEQVGCPKCGDYATAAERRAPEAERVRLRARVAGVANVARERVRAQMRANRRPEGYTLEVGTGKPGGVIALAILMLIGSVYALVHFVALAAGSVCLCVGYPPMLLSLVWAGLAMARAITLLQANPSRVPPTVLLVAQVLLILNLDLVNFALGVAGLIVARTSPVAGYWREESN